MKSSRDFLIQQLGDEVKDYRSILGQILTYFDAFDMTDLDAADFVLLLERARDLFDGNEY